MSERDAADAIAFLRGRREAMLVDHGDAASGEFLRVQRTHAHVVAFEEEIGAILPTVRRAPQSIAFRPPPLMPLSQREGSTTTTVAPASAAPSAAAMPLAVAP